MTVPLALDHVSIFTAVDAPEAAALTAAGLRGRGGVTRHGDFGTASTSFFFENAYLELFWAHDPAQTERSVKPAGIDVPARMAWRVNHTAPFGIMLRRRTPEAAVPFATQRLRAGWMPGEVWLEFAGQVAAEPYYAVVPEALAYGSFRNTFPDVSHPLGVRALTQVQLTVAAAGLSSTARLLSEAGLAALTPGPEPLMTLTFDGGVQGRTIDLRPTLPLVLKV